MANGRWKLSPEEASGTLDPARPCPAPPPQFGAQNDVLPEQELREHSEIYAKAGSCRIPYSCLFCLGWEMGII